MQNFSRSRRLFVLHFFNIVILKKLNEFLKTTQYDWKEGAQVGSDGSVGIGLDSAILPLKVAPELRMVQSTDFFYPIVDDPFIMGLITVSNVLSDLYATGVCEIDNMLMLLGVARDLVGDIRLEVVSKFMAGFQVNKKRSFSLFLKIHF